MPTAAPVLTPPPALAEPMPVNATTTATAVARAKPGIYLPIILFPQINKIPAVNAEPYNNMGDWLKEIAKGVSRHS